MKRDFNQWADELTHPDYQGFAPDRRLRVNRLLRPSFVSAGIQFLVVPPLATRSLRCGTFLARHIRATPFSALVCTEGSEAFGAFGPDPLGGHSRIATFTLPTEVWVVTFGFRCARVC